MPQAADLPASVNQELERFVEALAHAFGDDLASVVLYGSAAEGRLRPASDVNVLVLLERVGREALEAIREPYRTARASVGIAAMFLLREELPLAFEAFAVKFDDIRARHRVLRGEDPFAGLEPSRAAVLARLRPELLNVRIRLRERFALVGLREEQLASLAGELAPPLRSAAWAIVRLEGGEADSPRTALAGLAAQLGDPRFAPALVRLSQAREGAVLPPGGAAELVLVLSDLADALLRRAEGLV